MHPHGIFWNLEPRTQAELEAQHTRRNTFEERWHTLERLQRRRAARERRRAELEHVELGGEG